MVISPTASILGRLVVVDGRIEPITRIGDLFFRWPLRVDTEERVINTASDPVQPRGRDGPTHGTTMASSKKGTRSMG